MEVVAAAQVLVLKSHMAGLHRVGELEDLRLLTAEVGYYSCGRVGEKEVEEGEE